MTNLQKNHNQSEDSSDFVQAGSKSEMESSVSYWDRMRSENWSMWGVISALVIAVFQGVFTSCQLSQGREQLEVSQQQIQQSLRKDDWEFLAQINIRATNMGIEVENSSRTPANSFAYWINLENVHQESNEDNLSTLENFYQELKGGTLSTYGEVSPLGACTISTISYAHFPAFTGENGWNNRKKLLEVGNGYEKNLYVVIQAPSGKWYLKEGAGAIEEISSKNSDEQFESNREGYDATRAVSQAREKLEASETFKKFSKNYNEKEPVDELTNGVRLENSQLARTGSSGTNPVVGAGGSPVEMSSKEDNVSHLTYRQTSNCG